MSKPTASNRREQLSAAIQDPLRPKSEKERLLRELRQIEREAGIEGVPYNGGK